jgi:hypothetical protein
MLLMVNSPANELQISIENHKNKVFVQKRVKVSPSFLN